jgi:uncharacterized membrane protein YadS
MKTKYINSFVTVNLRKVFFGFLAAVLMPILGATAGTAPVDLGTADHFGALAGGAISGTGHVEGDVGSGAGAIAATIMGTGKLL